MNELSILIPRGGGGSSRNADALIKAHFVSFRRENDDDDLDAQGLCEVYKYEPAWNLLRALLQLVYVPHVKRFPSFAKLIELNGEGWSWITRRAFGNLGRFMVAYIFKRLEEDMPSIWFIHRNAEDRLQRPSKRYPNPPEPDAPADFEPGAIRNAVPVVPYNQRKDVVIDFLAGQHTASGN